MFAASDLFDIDRVEILRGPQSTLYGKNVTAGVVGIYTNVPASSFKWSTEFEHWHPWVSQDEETQTSDLFYDPDGFLPLILEICQAAGVSLSCTDNNPHNRFGCNRLAPMG